ncbi:MAG TPA: Asp-tRNA(Asn)/Glu-tRNA(Gln) amidotransferase subunit GatC [Thermoanaerobaculia bacterium]|nr:Asp-tRNA(Asn)/Glu-tRNA(Gln) amidotransferase subunit GatC [Thermoanaerobaculia bacterium]
MITPDQIRRIASLAKLELGPEELESMTRELARVLDYVDQLAGLDPGTAAEEPAPATPLRDDVISRSLDPATVEANAPAFAHGHFVVPRVFGGE